MPTWREDPAKVRPMLASLAEPPVTQAGLFYEPKYDGIRALADVRPGRRGAAPHVALYSRNGNDKAVQFPGIVQALARFAASLDGPVLFDGEIVAVDKKGDPLGFQDIQGRIHLTTAAEIARAEDDQPAALIVFDLLRDGDADLRGEPFAARRLRLQSRARFSRPLRRWLRLSELAADDGRPLLARATREGWEGLIVKDGRATYASGKRTPAWRKMKLLKQQEFVVGGWTEPRLSRQHFGALLLGYYESDRLRWAGSVGTGFDQAELDRVAAKLASLVTTQSPFADSFKTFERPHWVKPRLVAEVRFTEWTNEGLLRQPVYLGTREDKDAKDVTREEVRGDKGQEVRGDKGREVPAESKRRPHYLRRASHRTSSSERDSSSVLRGSSSPVLPGSVVDQLQSLESSRKDGDLALPNGDRVRVTNLTKLFWPKLGITKGELLRYYATVADLILPAVADRPLVMKRFPNGVDGQAFYQQRHPEVPPPGVRRELLPDDIEPIDEEGPRDRLIGGSITTLLYMAQLAAISQDPWFSTVGELPYQNETAIDLDPQPGAGFDKVLDVARWVKDELDRLSIPAVPKTSGSRGLHIYVPLPKRTTYETGQMLCQIVATIVSTKHPKVATIERMVKRRPRGTIYVDYLQNILGKTLATAYSARASDYAGVSTPLTWKEVEAGVDPRDFTVRTAPARFRDVGDLWARLRTGKPADLRAVLRKARA